MGCSSTTSRAIRGRNEARSPPRQIQIEDCSLNIDIFPTIVCQNNGEPGEQDTAYDRSASFDTRIGYGAGHFLPARTCMMFDVAAGIAAQAPGATFNSAALYLFPGGTSPVAGIARWYLLNVEATAAMTWNKFDGVDNWSAPGGAIDADYSSLHVSSTFATGDTTPKVIQMTRGMVTPYLAAGLMRIYGVMGDESGGVVNIQHFGSLGAVDPDDKPFLRLDVTPASAASGAVLNQLLRRRRRKHN